MSLLPIVRFDDSLRIVIDVAKSVLGSDALSRVVVHREAAGRLALFFDGKLSEGDRALLASQLLERLGLYGRADRIVADRCDPAADHVLDEPHKLWANVDGRRVALVDRRVVGLDWLAGPSATIKQPTQPPRVVFASLKGGVGRTTALCLTAAELARQGVNVLIVDLDLEAPGIGSLLLTDDQRPAYGVVDYLAESTVAEDPLLSEIIANSIAPSRLMPHLAGRVDILPAYGTRTLPDNYLGKLALALFDAGPAGEPLPVREKLDRMLRAAIAARGYDVVFIDARAGLAELAAGPLLGLDATVLLFGTAQRQTIDGYRLLFAHLNRLVPPDSNSPWQDIQLVLAKTSRQSAQNDEFREAMYDLFQEYLYEEQEGLDDFNYDFTDRQAPHTPIPIAFNSEFASWDPTHNADDLTAPFALQSTALLLEWLNRRFQLFPKGTP